MSFSPSHCSSSFLCLFCIFPSFICILLKFPSYLYPSSLSSFPLFYHSFCVISSFLPFFSPFSVCFCFSLLHLSSSQVSFLSLSFISLPFLCSTVLYHFLPLTLLSSHFYLLFLSLSLLHLSSSQVSILSLSFLSLPFLCSTALSFPSFLPYSLVAPSLLLFSPSN